MVIKGTHLTLEEAEKQKLNRGFKATTIIWAACLIALAIYLVIANVIPDVFVADHPGFPDPFAIVAYVLYGISIVCLFIAFFLRRYLLKSDSIIHQLTSQAAPYGIGSGAPLINFNPAALRYNTAIVVSLSFCQSIAIFGLILRILNADFASLYILVAVSAAALIYFRPKKAELYNLAVKMKQEQVAR
jgi:hypothetical protein